MDLKSTQYKRYNFDTVYYIFRFALKGQSSLFYQSATKKKSLLFFSILIIVETMARNIEWVAFEIVAG